MNRLQKLAKEWAENNSSAGLGDRDELYEILLSLQEQAYKAGFKKALQLSAEELLDYVGEEE